MATDYYDEQTFQSTTWTLKTVRIARAPKARSTVPAGRRFFARLPARDRRDPLTIKVKYRGGGGHWYEIHARGGILRVGGCEALHDVMQVINSQR